MLQRIIFLMALAITVQANGMNRSDSGFFKLPTLFGGANSSTTDTHQTQQPQQPKPAAPVVVIKPSLQDVVNFFKPKTEEPVKQPINYARLPGEERMKLMTPEEQEKLRIFEADQASIREENAKIKEEKQARKLQWAGEQIKNKTLAAEGADLIAALRGEEPPSSIYARMQKDASIEDKLIQGDLQKQNETVPLKPVELQITPEEKIKQGEEKLKQEEELKKQLEVQQVAEYKHNLSKAFTAIPEGDDLAKKLDEMGPDDVKNFHQQLQDAEKMSQQEIQENHLTPGAAEQYRREVLRLRFATDLDDEGAFNKRIEKLDTIVKLDTGMRLLENQNQFSRSDKVKTDLADLKKHNENPEAVTDQKRIDELKVWSEVAAKLGDDPEKAKDFFGTLKMSERLNNMATDPNQPFARAALNTEHKKLAGMLDGDTALLARVVPHDIQLSQKEQEVSVAQIKVDKQEQTPQQAYTSIKNMMSGAPEKYTDGLKVYRDIQIAEKALLRADKQFIKSGSMEDLRKAEAIKKGLENNKRKLENFGWGDNVVKEQHQKDVSKIRNRVMVGGVMATMMVAAIIWAATASTASQKSGAGKDSNEADQRVAGETSFATVLDEGYLAPSAQQPDGQYVIHPFITMISDQKLFGRTLTGDEQSSLSQQFNLIVTQTGNAGTLATKAMQDGRELTADEAQKMLDYKNMVEQAEKQFFVMELDIRYPCGPADGKYDVVADYQSCLAALQTHTVDIKKQLDAPTTGDSGLSDAKRVMLEAALENVMTEQLYLNKRMVLEREARDKFAELSQNKDLSQDQKDSQFQNYYQPARQANTALIVGDGQFIARQINEPFERSRNRRVPVLLGNEDSMAYTFVEPVPSAP